MPAITSFTDEKTRTSTVTSTSVISENEWFAVTQEILAISVLNENWDGNGASAPTQMAKSAALNLAKQSELRGENPPSFITPTPSGGILFDWENEDRDAEVFDDGDIRFLMPDTPCENQIPQPFVSEQNESESKQGFTWADFLCHTPSPV